MADNATPAAQNEGAAGGAPPAAAAAQPAATGAPGKDTDTRVAELSKESAAYRTQRNDALRRAHAFETMLKAHGIDTSAATTERLNALPVSGGQVDGVFEYSPPKIDVPKAKPPAARAEGNPALTIDQIKTWKPEEINKRWDEVQAVLTAKR